MFAVDFHISGPFACWAKSSNDSAALAMQNCVLQLHNFAKVLKEMTPSASESPWDTTFTRLRNAEAPHTRLACTLAFYRGAWSCLLSVTGHPPSATLPSPVSLSQQQPSQVSLPYQPTTSLHGRKSGDGRSDVPPRASGLLC